MAWSTDQLEQLAPWPAMVWVPPPVVSAESEFAPENVPCRHVFEKRVPCPYGEHCMFSHDPAVYMYANNLRICPNPNCGNYCRGLQCKQCHHAMKERRKAELHDCATEDCTVKTRFALCKGCHTAAREQQQRRPQQRRRRRRPPQE